MCYDNGIEEMMTISLWLDGNDNDGDGNSDFRNNVNVDHSWKCDTFP